MQDALIQLQKVISNQRAHYNSLVSRSKKIPPSAERRRLHQGLKLVVPMYRSLRAVLDGSHNPESRKRYVAQYCQRAEALIKGLAFFAQRHQFYPELADIPMYQADSEGESLVATGLSLADSILAHIEAALAEQKRLMDLRAKFLESLSSEQRAILQEITSKRAAVYFSAREVA